MALLQNTEAYSSPYVVLAESKEAPGYTDAIRRDLYEHHAAQCTTKSVTVQISLVDQPNEKSDADWFDVETAKYVAVPMPACWIRAKGVSGTDTLHVLSVRPNK